MTTGTGTATLTSTSSPRFRVDLKWVILGICVAVVAYLAVIPLGFLLWQSFFTPHTAAKPAEFTFGNYTAAYTSVQTAKLFLNSLWFAVGTAAFALITGTALAWMNERTNTPFKRLFFALALVPLIIPGILFTISWIMLASPKIGIFNLLLQRWFNTDAVFFNVYTMWGMIWVDGLHYSPMAFLLMTAAFRSMDPALEESAAMSGASLGQVVRRITLALSWPAIFATLLILFVRVVLPLLKPGLVAGWIYIAIVSLRELSSSILLYSPGTEVVSIMIWELWENGQYVELSALGVMLIVLLFVLVMVAQFLGSRFGVKEA